MVLVDFPRPARLELYQRAIDRMVARLQKIPGVKSIYQIGGVSNPGISDIDIYVVFNNGASCEINPAHNLEEGDKYFFIHELFGVQEKDFLTTRDYGFFHDYKLLWGDEITAKDGMYLDDSRKKVINRQVGLDFLLKMYINMTVEQRYKIIKVRNMLLHVKGLQYDLEYLDIKSGNAYDFVQTAVAWRNNWFSDTPGNKQIINWFNGFYQELGVTLTEVFGSCKLYVPEWASLRISRNVTLKNGSNLATLHQGMVFPSILGRIGRRYFNLQHRFNTFSIEVPLLRQDESGVLDERHRFIADLGEYNSRNIPHFSTGGRALSIYTRTS